MAKPKKREKIDTNKIKFVEHSDNESVEIESNDNEEISFSNTEEEEIRSVEYSDNESRESNEDEEKTLEQEEEEDNEEDEVDNDNNKFSKISWGKEKKNYYQNDSENSSSEDEEDQEERLKEAIYLNEKEKENLKEEDFDLGNFYIKDSKKGEEKDGFIKNKMLKLVGDMNKEVSLKQEKLKIKNKDKKEIEEILINEQEEYKILLNELSSTIEKVYNEIQENKELFEMKGQHISENEVAPNDINKNTLLYLKKRNETLLTYVIYICYYIFLKITHSYTHNHPVLEQLIYINTVIAKTNELDPRIKMKIQQLNNSFAKHMEEKDKEHANEEEEEEEEEKEGEEKLDVNSLEETEENENEVETSGKKKNDKYRISKSLITEYTDSHIREKEKEEKRKLREQRKQEKSLFIKEMKDIISNKPEVIEGEDYLKKIENKFRNFDEKITKKKMKIIDKKQKRRNLQNIGLTTNDLLQFVDLPEMNNKKSKNEHLQEKRIFQRNIQKVKQLNKNAKETKTNEDFVTYKNFDTMKKESQMRKDGMLQKEPQYKRLTLKEDDVEDEDIKQLMKRQKQQKEKKKEEKERKNKEIRKKLVEKENEIKEDRRKPTDTVIRNKGLVRKRKSTDGNARVHNRLKYEKRMKMYYGQHAKPKVHDNNYEGERRGINPYIKKSIDIK